MSGATTVGDDITQIRAIADAYGLKFASYEAGPGFKVGTKDDLSSVILSQREPGMKDVMKAWFTTFGGPFDILHQFSLAGLWSRYGSWGAAVSRCSASACGRRRGRPSLSQPRPAIPIRRICSPWPATSRRRCQSTLRCSSCELLPSPTNHRHSHSRPSARTPEPHRAQGAARTAGRGDVNVNRAVP